MMMVKVALAPAAVVWVPPLMVIRDTVAPLTTVYSPAASVPPLTLPSGLSIQPPSPLMFSTVAPSCTTSAAPFATVPPEAVPPLITFCVPPMLTVVFFAVPPAEMFWAPLSTTVLLAVAPSLTFWVPPRIVVFAAVAPPAIFCTPPSLMMVRVAVPPASRFSVPPFSVTVPTALVRLAVPPFIVIDPVSSVTLTVPEAVILPPTVTESADTSRAEMFPAAEIALAVIAPLLAVTSDALMSFVPQLIFFSAETVVATIWPFVSILFPAARCSAAPPDFVAPIRDKVPPAETVPAAAVRGCKEMLPLAAKVPPLREKVVLFLASRLAAEKSPPLLTVREPELLIVTPPPA